MRKRRSHGDKKKYKRPYKYLQDKVDTSQMRLWSDLDTVVQTP